MGEKSSVLTTEQFMQEITEINEKYDNPVIEKAFNVANKMHSVQLRRSGEPYIIHPVAVAKILAAYGMDIDTVVAGLLHDVVEDTVYTREQLVEEFSEEVALLVEGVTKLGSIKYDSAEELQAENFRKMFLAMAQDIRVLIIKLADRLHNMRTLEYMPRNKQIEKARETLEIYAPLAGRLGIYSIKFELEDLSFKYLYPEDYVGLSQEIVKHKEEKEKTINFLITEIDEILNDAGIEHTITGRSKHLYSIYKKMKTQNKGLEEIFDLLAIRVIVENVRDCYAVLGLVHNKWTPIPGRFKDYVAMPKSNMYQSLHTTVLDENGNPFEVQIRTKEMHQVAEYGIAAHWKYKEGSDKDDQNSEQKLAWIRQALELQQEADDSVEFLETMKMDLFDNQVFVFTPRGEVKELPAKATPLDFAFKIHTDIGLKCVGAKVNGKMVPIDYELKNGDIVEIITSANSSGPSMDWLKIAKSSQARNKIRNWLRKNDGTTTIEKGKEHLHNYIKNAGYDPALVAKNAYLIRAVKDMGMNNVNDLYNHISRGGSNLSKLGQRLIDYYVADNKEFEKKREEELRAKKPNRKETKYSNNSSGVVITGSNVDNILINLSRCCNPVPGEDIIGFITKGNGIAVHRTDCSNIRSLSEEEKNRLINVEWVTPKENATYYADVTMMGTDRKGLLSDISKVCDDNGVEIVGVNMPFNGDGSLNFTITLAINNVHQINRLMIAFRNIDSIDKVYRGKI